MDIRLEEKESDVSRIMRELIEYYIEMEGILNEIMEQEKETKTHDKNEI